MARTDATYLTTSGSPADPNQVGAVLFKDVCRSPLVLIFGTCCFLFRDACSNPPILMSLLQALEAHFSTLSWVSAVIDSFLRLRWPTWAQKEGHFESQQYQILVVICAGEAIWAELGIMLAYLVWLVGSKS